MRARRSRRRPASEEVPYGGSAQELCTVLADTGGYGRVDQVLTANADEVYHHCGQILTENLKTLKQNIMSLRC
jgi:hypothetical protein